jgi:outer membrane protein assembly factor BamA
MLPPASPAPPLVRAIFALGVAFACVCAPRFARADNTLNSNEKSEGSDEQQPAAPKNDFTIVPVAGGSTDVGVGGGFFSALTRNQAGRAPFIWNIETAWFISFALPMGKNLVVPYDDGYAKWTVTRFLGTPMQLELRPSFTDEEALYYYGIGNASTTARPRGEPDAYFRYGRVHPSLRANLTFRLMDHLAGEVGVRYTASWLHAAADSKLAADERGGSPEVQRLIGNTSGVQSVALFQYGIHADTRDNETSPRSGTWDEAVIKLSPGGTRALPYRYGDATVTLRAYVPLGHRVTLAARAVGDLLFGDVPFVELPRFEDTYALGGSNGVRGIPGQRYYGKVKAFGNLELRARLFDFHLLGKVMAMGGAVFVDGGRLWADFRPHPELDGPGWGIKYGVGGGLRLSSGTAFVLRGDVAWSPDATPIGGYVAAGEMF